MATTYKAPQAAAAKNPRTGENGLFEAIGVFNIQDAVDNTNGGGAGAAAFVINDVVQMVRIPANCRIKEVILSVPSLDTSTGIVLDVGVSGSTNKFISGSTKGRSSAGGVDRLNNEAGHNYIPAAEVTVDLKINTAATGTAAITGTIRLSVIYSMQGLLP